MDMSLSLCDLVVAVQNSARELFLHAWHVCLLARSFCHLQIAHPVGIGSSTFVVDAGCVDPFLKECGVHKACLGK